jgi:hypothetical protein
MLLIFAGSQPFLNFWWSTDGRVRSTEKMAALTRKREARKSLCQPGWITFEGGFAARQCVVQDLSSTGARISIDDPNSLPARLRLAFARDELGSSMLILAPRKLGRHQVRALAAER